MALQRSLDPIPVIGPAPFPAPVQPGSDGATASALLINARWEQLILRLGFVSTGVILFHWAMLSWGRGNIYVHRETVYVVMAEYAAAFAVLALGLSALSRSALQRLAVLIPVVVLLAMLAQFYVEIGIWNRAYGTDTLAFSHEAATRLVDGQNPFSVRGADAVAEASKKFGVPPEHITRRTDGSPIDNLMSWPAGSFLAFVVPSALGLGDMRWVIAAAEILTFAMLWLFAPRILRPLMFIPLLGDPYLSISLTTGGASDMLWVLPVVGSAFALRHRHFVLAALLFGLAAGTKQQPWVLAPFLLIWVWYAYPGDTAFQRLRPIASFIAWSTAGFLALNGPFMVWDWHGWLRGTLFPLQDDLIPWGSGLSMLTQTGILDLPKSFYSLATFGVWGLLVLVYALNFRSLKHLIWIFPAIIMWFSYRSLHTYFIFWMPLIVLALFFWWEDQSEDGAIATA